MTELQLYKFIQDNGISLDWRGDELLLWVPAYLINDFAKMIKSMLDGEYMDCVLVNGGEICVDLTDICYHYDIDPENILPRQKS